MKHVGVHTVIDSKVYRDLEAAYNSFMYRCYLACLCYLASACGSRPLSLQRVSQPTHMRSMSTAAGATWGWIFPLRK